MSPEFFSIYSQSLPSQNLGFVDPKCSMLDIEVAGRNLSIVQSPALLSSDRAGGTTGAGQPLPFRCCELRLLIMLQDSCLEDHALVCRLDSFTTELLPADCCH